MKPTNVLESWQFEEHFDGTEQSALTGRPDRVSNHEARCENWHVQAYQTRLDLEEWAARGLCWMHSSSAEVEPSVCYGWNERGDITADDMFTYGLFVEEMLHWQTA